MTRNQKIVHVSSIAVGALAGVCISVAMGGRGWPLLLMGAVNLITSAIVMETFERVPIFSKFAGLTEITEQKARSVNLPRRKFERVSDWRERVTVAHLELCDATAAYIEAAQIEGFTIHVGDAEQWVLPPTHPASIRLAKARGEPLMFRQSAYRN